jgi:hypothetical protein
MQQAQQQPAPVRRPVYVMPQQPQQVVVQQQQPQQVVVQRAPPVVVVEQTRPTVVVEQVGYGPGFYGGPVIGGPFVPFAVGGGWCVRVDSTVASVNLPKQGMASWWLGWPSSVVMSKSRASKFTYHARKSQNARFPRAHRD